MPSLSDKLQSDGYVEITETDTAVSTAKLARQISESIGALVSASPDSLVASHTGEKPLNTYGGNFGHGQLPLHTDLAHWYRPLRYVLLRCISGTPTVATHLFSRRQLESWVPESLMKRALFSPRRRLDGKLFLLQMIDNELLRWDQLFLKPQNAAARIVTEMMHDIAADLPLTSVALERAGQTLLVDNWAVLHGRSAIPLSEPERKLDRIYLEKFSSGN